MKAKRIGTTVIAIALLVGGGAINTTYAMESEDQLIKADYQSITPLWISIADITPYISAEGRTLYPEAYIKAKSSSGSISGTMYLEKYSLGRWTSVTSWSFSGTSSVFLSKSYRGTSGVKYRTKVLVTVDGENAVATSGSCEI